MIRKWFEQLKRPIIIRAGDSLHTTLKEGKKIAAEHTETFSETCKIDSMAGWVLNKEMGVETGIAIVLGKDEA